MGLTRPSSLGVCCCWRCRSQRRSPASPIIAKWGIQEILACTIAQKSSGMGRSGFGTISFLCKYPSRGSRLHCATEYDSCFQKFDFLRFGAPHGHCWVRMGPRLDLFGGTLVAQRRQAPREITSRGDGPRMRNGLGAATNTARKTRGDHRRSRGLLEACQPCHQLRQRRPLT